MTKNGNVAHFVYPQHEHIHVLRSAEEDQHDRDQHIDPEQHERGEQLDVSSRHYRRQGCAGRVLSALHVHLRAGPVWQRARLLRGGPQQGHAHRHQLFHHQPGAVRHTALHPGRPVHSALLLSR